MHGCTLQLMVRVRKEGLGSGVTRHEAAEAVASVNKMGVALQKFC